MEIIPDRDQEKLLNQIKSEGMSAMLTIYRLHRDKYLSFTKQYTADRDLRLQSYNDAIVQSYNAITNNRFDPLKSSLKTYIFTLGKNKLINRLNKENTYSKHISHEELKDSAYDTNSDQGPPEAINEKLNTELSKGFDQLGEKCRNLILYFYYDKLDSEEIMKLMNYDSTNVVYSAKSRCLKKLREIIIKSRG